MTSGFIELGWTLIIDQKDEGRNIISYINIVYEFYRKLSSASRDNEASTILVWGALVTFLVDALANFIGILRLPTAYPNVVPRESTTAGYAKMAEDNGFDANGRNGLADHEVRQLVVGSDVPPYDRTKRIKQDNLSGFFKILNIITSNNIDPR